MDVEPDWEFVSTESGKECILLTLSPISERNAITNASIITQSKVHKSNACCRSRTHHLSIYPRTCIRKPFLVIFRFLFDNAVALAVVLSPRYKPINRRNAHTFNADQRSGREQFGLLEQVGSIYNYGSV